MNFDFWFRANTALYCFGDGQCVGLNFSVMRVILFSTAVPFRVDSACY